MREIVLDTETTGMDPAEGDKIVEIGCVELLNHVPTGRKLHVYLNPERDVPAEATAVHGLTRAFLRDKPVFSQIYTDFLEFIGDDGVLVIHNAAFDVKFLNAELKAVGHKGLGTRKIVDTLLVARQKFPGSPASLDALCRRFEIDNSGRELHGALLDAQLLAEVYLEMMGGRQHGLGLAAERGGTGSKTSASGKISSHAGRAKKPREKRVFSVPADELAAHEKFLEKIKDALWKKKA